MNTEMKTRYMTYLERLDKLTKKGGNARLVAKLKRRIRALEAVIAA